MTRKLETPGYCYVEGQVLRETALAIRFDDGTRQVWLPKSQIEDPDEFPPFEHLELLIPEWLAKQEGLI